MKLSLKMLLLALLSLAALAFIFGNSLQTASLSTDASDFVIDLLTPILALTPIDPGSYTFVIRKLAHFSEFALLGIFLGATARNFSRRAYLLWGLSGGVLAAVVDETIQRFVDGRSSELRDVLIDAAGVFCGLCVYALYRTLRTWIARRSALRSAS